MTRRITWGVFGWGVGWLLLAVLVCTLLWGIRGRVIAELDRPEIRADWQRWKNEARRQSALGKGPVQRRPPPSNEPPALILMRDHFPSVIVGSLVLGSCLYLFLALAAQGMWRTRNRGVSGARDRPAGVDERRARR